MKPIAFTWEREDAYRRALQRISLSPATRLVVQRGFDDYTHVFQIIISKRLHEVFVKQLATIPATVRGIAAERVYGHLEAIERDLLKRFEGCDLNRSLLIDTTAFGPEHVDAVNAIVAIFEDQVILCRRSEVRLGPDFVHDRIRVRAELMAAKMA